MEKPQLATWLLWGVFCFLKNVTPHKEKKKMISLVIVRIYFNYLLWVFFFFLSRNFGALAFGKLSKFELKFPSKCSIRQIRMAAKTHESVLSGSNSESKRGALIVLEGLDRSGKTSQSSKLLTYLEGLGHSAELWRFPDRSTNVGKMISMYLSNKSQLDDHTIHLLFSANRWEKRFVMSLFFFSLL